jgi:hypothetical protein
MRRQALETTQGHTAFVPLLNAIRLLKIPEEPRLGDQFLRERFANLLAAPACCTRRQRSSTTPSTWAHCQGAS